jgi:hypothetical protein
VSHGLQTLLDFNYLQSLWTDLKALEIILTLEANPFSWCPFSHDAAYQYWHLLNMKEWWLDDDPLALAVLLLSHASVGENGDGECALTQVFNIKPNVDYDTLAFSILEILTEWANQINELVMDSACKQFV